MTIQDFLKPDHWMLAEGGPRYLQLRKRLEDSIKSGLMGTEAPLPAEREIAALTGLSRVTVRRAMQDLVDKGIVVQKQGSGSFVSDGAPKVEQVLTRLTSFTEDMSQRGVAASIKWLSRGLFEPTAHEAIALGLSTGEQVARIARLRLANERPMAIDHASLPSDLLPDPKLVKHSLYEALAENGNRPVRAIQKISAINLEPEDAALLDVAPNVAGLRIERTSYLQNRRVVEFTRSIYRADAYEFVAELNLTRD